MRRRDFVKGIVGAAATWAQAARAQQSLLPVVGILDDTDSRYPKFAPFTGALGCELRVANFRQGLSEGGLVEGRDVTIDLRSTEQYAQLRPLVDQLVQRRVAVIA